MELPPWVKLCERCKCHYVLAPACPWCGEKAVRQEVNGFGRRFWFCLAAAIVCVVVLCLLFPQLLEG